MLSIVGLTALGSACTRDGSDSTAAVSPVTSSPNGSSPGAIVSASVESPTPASSVPVIDGMFRVDGTQLYLHCEGKGSPTVVYVHGFIETPAGGGSTNAGAIPDYVASHERICVYDRPNVGASDTLPGPVTGLDDVHLLRGLLDAAEVRPPYVLLGASLGGLLSYMYAATYIHDVVGMVLLDPVMPDDIEIDAKYVPADAQVKPNWWKSNTEALDLWTTFHQAQTLERQHDRLAIPMTMIATKHLDIDPTWPVRKITAAERALQHRFVAMFSPGKQLVLDVPHYMEPVIPKRIAAVVQDVIAETR